MARFASGIVLCVTLLFFCSAQKSASKGDIDFSLIRTVTVHKRPTKIVDPLYPKSAKLAGIQGPVVLDIVIGKSGEVEWVQPFRGPKKLSLATAEALKQWKWEPFLLNETPIRVCTKVIVYFVLDAPGSPKAQVD